MCDRDIKDRILLVINTFKNIISWVINIIRDEYFYGNWKHYWHNPYMFWVDIYLCPFFNLNTNFYFVSKYILNFDFVLPTK